MLSNESLTNADAEPGLQGVNWEQLRRKSVQQGGFGDDRVDIWPKLLNVSPEINKNDDTALNMLSEEDQPHHQDERQIGLDTDRSFVLYPVEHKTNRAALQAGLHQLLVSLFRKRPQLNYFQGYHDIVTVFFLTLPEELQLPCVEKISLHRLRDSMGQGLEPVLGLLRVTKNLLRLVDLEYARMLEQTSPLPFFALSNLLTLFAHDMPTLPLIQHVFDYLLSRPPIASVYLATAIILARKQEAIRLEEEDEGGMIHSLLSSLPELVDGPFNPKVEETPFQFQAEESVISSDHTFFKENGDLDVINDPAKSEVVETKIELTQNSDTMLEDLEKPAMATIENGDLQESHHTDDTSPQLQSTNATSPIIGGDSTIDHVNLECRPLSAPDSEMLAEKDNAALINPMKVEDSDSAQPSLSANPKRSQLILIEILKHADELYEKFPPSHPGLALSSIMGPQSVVFTWSESPSDLPSDNTAEAMLSRPELVVYPYVEPKAEEKEDDNVNGGKKSLRRRRKLRKSPFRQMEKKTMLAGTIIVLGVAMAVYGIKARGPGGHTWIHSFADGHAHATARDWKRAGGWVGGVLVGLGQKILNGLPTTR